MPKARIWRPLALCTLAVLGPIEPSEAALITSNTLVAPTIIDFSQFRENGLEGVSGPIAVGEPVGENVTYEGNPNTGLYAWNGLWGLSSNGDWDSGREGYIAIDRGTMILAFLDGPVSGVGGFMNYCPAGDELCDDAPLVLAAFGLDNTLLETYSVTISTPRGLNDGAFRGIQRLANDIAYFHVIGHAVVLDDLAFSRTSVAPEPASLTLFALGVLSLELFRRRRH